MKNDYYNNDFWVKKDDNGNKRYFMKVDKQWIEVSRPVYLVCKSSYQKMYRDNRRDFNVVYHYDDVDLMQDYCSYDFETDIINQLYIDELKTDLYRYIHDLTYTDRKIIVELYFNNKTLTKLAEEMSMPTMTLYNKKMKILKKLREKLVKR